jgi:hypothetical protein
MIAGVNVEATVPEVLKLIGVDVDRVMESLVQNIGNNAVQVLYALEVDS